MKGEYFAILKLFYSAQKTETGRKVSELAARCESLHQRLEMLAEYNPAILPLSVWEQIRLHRQELRSASMEAVGCLAMEQARLKAYTRKESKAAERLHRERCLQRGVAEQLEQSKVAGLSLFCRHLSGGFK